MALNRRKYYLLGVSVLITGISLCSVFSSGGDYEPTVMCGVPMSSIDTTRLDTLGLELTVNYPCVWKGKKELKVYFEDLYDRGLIGKILSSANEWAKFTKLPFRVTVDRQNSDIRVSVYQLQSGYRSLIGNSAKDHPGQTTMWLENIGSKSEKEFRRLVLHEFGHALGLEHELQNPSFSVSWDTAALFHYCDSLYKWDTSMVWKYILTKAKTREYTVFDPESIMIYGVPGRLMKGMPSIAWPEYLSHIDTTRIINYYH